MASITKPVVEKRTDERKSRRLAGLKRDAARETIVIRGVKVGDRVNIPYDKLDELNVDPRYQRSEQVGMVNQIVRALLAGGQISDAIHVAVRNDGSKWIVDGRQRWERRFWPKRRSCLRNFTTCPTSKPRSNSFSCSTAGQRCSRTSS
jgi:hypothetical protein